MAIVVRNTAASSYRAEVERAVDAAVKEYPDSASWTVDIQGFVLRPGFTIVIRSADAVVGVWLFDDPGDVERRLREDLGP